MDASVSGGGHDASRSFPPVVAPEGNASTVFDESQPWDPCTSEDADSVRPP